jgi:hypothetical protein
MKKWLPLLACAAIVSSSLLSSTTANAAPPAPATFGVSWDGAANDLQHIVDVYTGVPGAINVTTDYMGAHDGDLDPWFWIGTNVPALLVTEVAANKDLNTLGWYLENGGDPRVGFVPGGVVFSGPQGNGATTVITFPSGVAKFGFSLDTHHLVNTATGTANEVFYTNRHFNDAGPFGQGALRAPLDGDVQALVFDVSQWKGKPNTWLVCFEDLDAGQAIQPCCTGTDDDYNDFVFEISALGATPTTTLSFGALKALYR